MRDNPFATLGYELRTLSRDQLGLRLVPVASGAVFALAAGLAGDPGSTAVVGMLVAGLLAAAFPQGLVPLVVVVYLAGGWAAAVETEWSPFVLPAALSLLLLHTACALAATMPASAALPEGYWALHGRRVGVVAAVTAGVWALAWVASRAPLPGGPVPMLAGLASLALGGATAYRALRTTSTP
jgi:hypothetical protein